MSQTGRALDVAVRGEGWIAVQGLDGNEAYTRSGHLEVSGEGTLVNRSGLPVLSDGGPIPYDTLVVAHDVSERKRLEGHERKHRDRR